MTATKINTFIVCISCQGLGWWEIKFHEEETSDSSFPYHYSITTKGPGEGTRTWKLRTGHKSKNIRIRLGSGTSWQPQSGVWLGSNIWQVLEINFLVWVFTPWLSSHNWGLDYQVWYCWTLLYRNETSFNPNNWHDGFTQLSGHHFLTLFWFWSPIIYS